MDLHRHRERERGDQDGKERREEGKAPHLIDGPRNSEGERINPRLESFSGREPLHRVGALHHSDVRPKGTEAGVLENLTRPEGRLLSDDARAAHPLAVPIRVGDDPLAAQELRRLRPHVTDSDVVREEKVTLGRLAPLRNVGTLDLDSNAGCRRIAHRAILQWPEPYQWPVASGRLPDESLGGADALQNHPATGHWPPATNDGPARRAARMVLR